ncbi:MAG TPA: ParB/RepB/Spo0J family partition protein [Pyrinomonadaceae bacterium]
MSKRGLPVDIKMRHDAHYVEELSRPNRTVGKIIPINQIEPNPEQPRVEIGDLTELADSIKQNGVLEPILVKPNRQNGSWMIIAGERRWRAANLAGLREVPCIELDLDEKSIAEIALIENLQRKDLTIWEEADGLAALNEKFGYTHEEIAKKIGRSRTTVTELMSIAGLPEQIREKCRQSNLTAKSVLLEIARQFDEAAMNEFVGKIVVQNLNRDKIRQTARPQNLAGNNAQKAKSNKPLKNSAAEMKHSNNSSNVFKYISNNGDFKLQLEFGEANVLDKNNVLKALKEAFEKVKNEGIE